MNRLCTMLGALVVMISLGGPLFAGGGQEDSAAGDATPRELQEITVVLDWLPNTNHAGLYLAKHRGWFQEEGLAVEIVQPSEVGSEALIAGGRGDIGISHQEALTFARTADAALPVVAIAAILQHNTSGYAAPADRNLDGPQDFAGLDYGGWGTAYEDAMLNAVMAPHGSSAEDVTTVNVGTMDIFVAFQRDIDFTWIFYGWDGTRAEVEGVDLDFFPLTDLDPRLDYYTPLFIASEETLSEDPDMVEAFLRATTRGYRAVVADPDTAASVLREYAPEIGADHAVSSLRYLSDYLLADSGEWGSMDRLVWERFTDFMDEQGLLQNPLDIDAAFTNEYIHGANEGL